MVCHFTNLRPTLAAENRQKNGSCSKAELAIYKRLWRYTFGRRPKQLAFSNCPL
jgi:hypothetical protein